MPRTPEMIWLICYDVTSARRRRAVSKLLENVGFRVQKSVFEVRLTPRLFVSLKEELKERMSNEDRIHFYPLCGSCAERIVREGDPVWSPDDGLWSWEQDEKNLSE